MLIIKLLKSNHPDKAFVMPVFFFNRKLTTILAQPERMTFLRALLNLTGMKKASSEQIDLQTAALAELILE